MKQDKKKNGIIVLLTVSNLILLTLVILFATETIKLKSHQSDEFYQNNPSINCDNNDSQEKDNIPEQDVNQNESEEPVDTDNLEEDIYNTEDYLDIDELFSGIVEVTGYPEIKVLSDEIYDYGKKYQYVYFHITEMKNDKFEKYLESLKGNTFALDNAIGLGCLIDSKIQYYNLSDELGEKKFELSKKDTDKILNATKNNPIKLKLEKKLLTFGKGAPVCSSHMTKIEVK